MTAFYSGRIDAFWEALKMERYERDKARQAFAQALGLVSSGTLDSAAAFFAVNAPTSYDPASETQEQGTRRGALELAAAELAAASLGWRVSWSADWSLGCSHARFYGPEAYESEPETCETAVLVDLDDETLGALGCIDDATSDYRRVVAAELALEVLAGLEVRS